jgi:hypothetical protein
LLGVTFVTQKKVQTDSATIGSVAAVFPVIMFGSLCFLGCKAKKSFRRKPKAMDKAIHVEPDDFEPFLVTPSAYSPHKPDYDDTESACNDLPSPSYYQGQLAFEQGPDVLQYTQRNADGSEPNTLDQQVSFTGLPKFEEDDESVSRDDLSFRSQQISPHILEPIVESHLPVAVPQKQVSSLDKFADCNDV